MSPDGAASTNDLAKQRTDLAAHRTTMAASRSLMAWVRTGLALMGYGYTFYKILQSFSDRIAPNTARNIGLILIAWGTLSIIFGSIEYWRTIHEIRKDHDIHVRRFPQLFAGGFIALGVIVFLGVILRIV